jgi:hypothetical protein
MMQFGPTRPGLTNLWHAAFIVVPIYLLLFLPDQSLYCEEHVLLYIYLAARRLRMNYRCYQITLRVKQLYTNRERCEVLTGCLLLVS